jgi:hypothetical protein
MNKQEFQQTIKNMKPPKFFTAITLNEAYEAGFEEAKGNALYNSCFLNEPEKPVVPQYIADWLEVCKENLGFGLSTAMSHSTSAMKKQPNWVKGWFNLKDNQETFAKAWMYGYEVDKEKLYTVEIPNPISDGYTKVYLGRNEDNKVGLCILGYYSATEFADNWKQLDSAKLTESEIKKDFEWAFRWAKEVEE